MKNFKQYLEEASQRGARNQGLRSTVDQEGNHTPGLIRKVIGALGGQRISSANAEESKQSRKIVADRARQNRVGIQMHDVHRILGKKVDVDDMNEMMKDPNRRPIDWEGSGQPGPRPTSPPITGRPPIEERRKGRSLPKPNKEGNHGGRYLPKPNMANNHGGRSLPKPNKEGNHPMQEDSGERGGSPEDGNTGYGLPRKNSRFYPATNPRPTGPGTEYHMETLRQKYEAKKAAEAAAAAEAAKAAGEQEPEHWRDFPTDVRYDQYGDQD